jgi:hypothetical protein
MPKQYYKLQSVTAKVFAFLMIATRLGEVNPMLRPSFPFVNGADVFFVEECVNCTEVLDYQ